MKSRFHGGAYTLDSRPLAAQTCINLFFEPSEAVPGEGEFVGTPGLLRKQTMATMGCRDSHVAGGYLWAVYGNAVYRLDAAYSPTLIGLLPNSTGPVKIEDNGTYVVVAHPGGWHSVTMSSLAFAFVPNSPSMSDVTFIDNYLVGAQENGTYCWANLNSTTIDALSFASAEGSPDRILRTLSDHRELWQMGEKSIEVAVVTSDQDLPFTRTRFIEQGILAPKSACKIDNTIYWLGTNEDGGLIVYRAEGDTPIRTTTFALEQEFLNYASPETATAYAYQQGGHHFYVINFAEATWAYDINTRLWAQRAYRNTTTGELERHRGEAHAYFRGKHILGDYEDGRLYALDPNTFTDDGDLIYSERAFPGERAENRWVTYHRGELEAEMGVGNGGNPGIESFLMTEDGDYLTDEESDFLMTDEGTADPGANPRVWLQWSNDGGFVWGSAHDRYIGQIGEYANRAIWRRMGKGRRRVFKLWTTDPVRRRWYAFNYDTDVSNG